MADKNYKIQFTMSDGTTEAVSFTAPQGEKGEDGTGVTILGSYDTESALNAAHPTGEAGEAYLVAGDLYVWSATKNKWVNVGTIQGPQGEQGDPGVAAGFGTPTATVDANTGTPSVSVTASGSDTAKVFNFAFKNLKGERGNAGRGIASVTIEEV